MMLFNTDIQIVRISALKGSIHTVPGADNYYGSLLEPDNPLCKDCWTKEPLGDTTDSTSSIDTTHCTTDDDDGFLVNNSIAVYPEGDLMLILINKENNRVVRTPVSSEVMADASPVWQKMLDTTSPLSSVVKDGYVDQKDGGRSWDTLTLKEDDQLAMCIVLHALHRRDELVPTSVQPEQLFHIAVICDKYDCAGTLLQIEDGIGDSTLVELWVKDNNIYQSLVEQGWEGWLVIADVFGFEGLEEVAWCVSREVSIAGERVEDWSIGRVEDANTTRKLGQRDGRDLSYVSDGILDWILKARKLQLEFIITHHKAIYDFLFSEGSITPMIQCLTEGRDLLVKQYSASDIILDWGTPIGLACSNQDMRYVYGWGGSRCYDENLRSKIYKWFLEEKGDDVEEYTGSVFDILEVLEEMYMSHDISECNANRKHTHAGSSPCLAPSLVMKPAEEFMSLLKRLCPDLS